MLQTGELSGDLATRLDCPKCGLVDQVRKVSAIQASDTSYDTSSGSTIGAMLATGKRAAAGVSNSTTTGFRRSELSLKLMPPSPPPKPDVSRGSPVQTVYALFAGAALATVIGLVNVGPLVGANRQTLDDISKPVFCGIVATALFVAGLVKRKNAARNEQELRERAARKLGEWNSSSARWRNAVARWNRLYYCCRDDVVFDPEDGAWAPVDDLQSFTYGIGRPKDGTSGA